MRLKSLPTRALSLSRSLFHTLSRSLALSPTLSLPHLISPAYSLTLTRPIFIRKSRCGRSLSLSLPHSVAFIRSLSHSLSLPLTCSRLFSHTHSLTLHQERTVWATMRTKSLPAQLDAIEVLPPILHPKTLTCRRKVDTHLPRTLT